MIANITMLPILVDRLFVRDLVDIEIVYLGFAMMGRSVHVLVTLFLSTPYMDEHVIPFWIIFLKLWRDQEPGKCYTPY